MLSSKIYFCNYSGEASVLKQRGVPWQEEGGIGMVLCNYSYEIISPRTEN